MRIAGQVAVVTGGASGIGAACAARLADQGAEVITWDQSDEADVQCDVASETSVDDAMNWTIENAGTPTILVTSAGVRAPITSIHTLDVDAWDRTFAVNTKGTFLTIRAVARAMIEAKLGGSFAAISSVNGQIADPGMAAYSASKAAVFHMVKVAAQDLGPHQIRVNAIGPGPTETPMLAYRLTDEYRQEVGGYTPLGRIGTAELVADSTVNVIRSDWITGQAIMVDGGSSLVTAMGPQRLTRALARAAETNPAAES